MASSGNWTFRAAKIVLAALAGLAGLAVVAVVLLVFWANTQGGRERLTGLAAAGAAAAGLELRVESVSGRLPFAIEAERVVVADASGPWLEIDGFRFAWRPGGLLLGRIHVRRIGAQRVALARLPELAAGEPREGPAEPVNPADWLRRIRIDALDFDRIELADPVLGQQVVFAVDGRFGVHEGRVRASRLRVTGLEGHGTTLTTETAWDPDRRWLALSAQIQAPPGGVLAGLVGVAEGSGIDVSVSGEGPLDEWEGTVAAVAGEARGDLRLETGRIDGHRVLALAGRVDPAGLLARHVAAHWAALADGGVDISLRMDEVPGEGIRVSDLDIRSGAVELTGAGTLARPGETLEANLRLRQPGDATFAAPPAGVERLEGLDLKLEARGPWARPAVSVEGDVAVFRGVGVNLGGGTLAGGFAPEGPEGLRGPLSLQVTADHIAWALDGSEPLVRGPAALTAAGALSEGPNLVLDTLELTLPDARATGTLALDLTRSSLHAPLQVEIADLSALDGLARVDLEGQGRFDVDLRLPNLDGRVEVDVAARLTDSALILPVAGTLVGEQTRLDAKVVVDPGSGLSVAPLRISGDRAVVTGQVRMPAAYDRLQVDAVADLPDGEPLGNALGLSIRGPVRAEASLDGPPADPGVVATVTASRLTAGGVPLDEVTLSCELANLASGLNGPVGLSAVAPGGPLEASTRLRMTDDRLELGALSARNAATNVSGALAVHFAGAPLSGNLSVDLADAEPWLAMAGLDGQGNGSVTLDFSGPGDQQFLTANLQARDLRVARPGGRTMFAKELTAAVDLADLFSAPAMDARLEARKVRGPSADLPRLTLVARGPMNDLTLSTRTGGAFLGAPAELALDVGIVRRPGETRIRLDGVEGELAGQPIQLRGGSVLTLGAGGAELTETVIAVGSGELRGALATGSPGAYLDLAADDIPLPLLTLAEPRLELEGRADAALRLDDAGQGAAGTMEFQVQDLRMTRRRSAPPISARLQGTLGAEGLAFEARAEGGTAEPMEARGTFPLTVDLVAGSAVLRREGPVAARVDWQGEATRLLNLLPASDHVLSGPVTLRLALSGTVSTPRVEGRFQVSQGRYEHLSLGTILEPLNLLLVADGRELRLEQLETLDGGSGRITGSGRVDLDPDAGWPAALTVTMEKARLLRRDDVTAQVSGEIRVRGGGDGRVVEGRLVTDEVRANLVNRLPPEVVVLDVIDARTLELGEDAGAESAERAGPATDLDITVEIPRRMYVSGLGLDSEWEGQFVVGGTSEIPRLTGRLESVRGIMQFLGRRFRFEPSSITFAGGRKIDPELDITAIHEATDITVTVRVSGPVSDVDIDLASVPSFPEDEILSRTLFGKSTGELSALEAVQLAAALGELTGSGGGAASVMGRLRDTAGIDVLRFGSTETEEGEEATTVEAGKYLAEGLYVGVETSTAEESGAVSVEFDITRRLRLKTDLEQTGGQNIGIEYKRDY